MAKSLSYKKTTSVALNVKGDYNAEDGTIELADSGEVKKLSDLLKDFEGTYIELSVKIKEEEDLEDNLTE
jgi:hypothetical protein